MRIRRGQPRRLLRTLGITAVVSAVLVSVQASALARDAGRAPTRLTGSGSTFSLNYVQSAIGEFAQRRPPVVVKYIGNDSKRSVDAFLDRRNDFVGVDGPLPPDDIASAPGGTVLYFPLVVAPLAIVYNIAGVTDLRLSPDTVAAIFDGGITRWNAPAIKLENPDTNLPDLPVTVVHDARNSGTSQNFTSFLARTAPQVWEPRDPSSPWPANSTAGAGNFGIAQIVKATPGTIGYVDYPNARALALPQVSVKNAVGMYVAPSVESASAAASIAVVNRDLTFDATGMLGTNVYPITTGSWIALYAQQTDGKKAAALRALLRFVYGAGQNIAGTVDYAALPPEVVRLARAQIDQISAPPA